MHSWQAPPINEGAEDPAVAQAGQHCRHPRFIEGEEFSIGHFARRHGKLAVLAPGDVAGDLHVVRLVGQDETGGRIALR
jgi:hypothetical protein